MGFQKKVSVSYSPELSAQIANGAVTDQEAEQVELRPRTTLKKGLNVLMVLPSKSGTRPDPYRHTKIHYKPFHVCGRGDTIEQVDEKTGESKFNPDNRFSNCIRCLTAWNNYQDAGGKPVVLPGTQEYKDFKANMASDRTVIQVLNVDPFFTVKQGNPSVDKALVDAWFGEYTRILTELRDGTPWNEIDVPNDMPEDIADAALSGVSVILLNEKAGKNFSSALRQAAFDNDCDPLQDPSKRLLRIKVEPDPSRAFPSGGKTIIPNSYDSAFFNVRGKSWEVDEDLVDVIWDLAIDIHAPENSTDHETLEDRARGFVRLSETQMVEYLESKGHTYVTQTEAAPSEHVEDAEEDDEEEAHTSDFTTSTNGTSSADLRGRFGRK